MIYRQYRMYEKEVLTVLQMSAMPRKVGRNKEYPVRITLPLAEGVTERIDALCRDGEARVDFIRAAIDRETKRREEEQKRG